MKKTHQQQIMREAYQYWITDRPLIAGSLIFESVPVEKRHQWAAEILEFVYLHLPSLLEVDQLLEFAKNPNKWGEGKEGDYHHAHQLVDMVNQRETPLMALATQVGKVVYTAQQFPAPFDHSAGAKIATVLKKITQQINTIEFEQEAWKRLCDERFIKLEQLVMCHPACPVCRQNGLVPE